MNKVFLLTAMLTPLLTSVLMLIQLKVLNWMGPFVLMFSVTAMVSVLFALMVSVVYDRWVEGWVGCHSDQPPI